MNTSNTVDKVICWPKKLPLPTIEGYRIAPSDAIVRTDMESGSARQRRRFTQVPSLIQVRWLFSQEQFAVFESWYRWKAQEGGRWFDITLLGGLGLLSQQARFTKQFEAELLTHALWEVTTELEIRERPVLTQSALTLLLDEELNPLLNAIDAFHLCIHQTLPDKFAA